MSTKGKELSELGSILSVADGTANIEGSLIVANSVTIGNSTVNTTFTATSIDANTVGGNTASDLRNYSDTVAGTAYTNAASYADTAAGTAYSNATSYADTAAGTAYSNATSYSDTVAGTAYSNATAYSSNATNITSGTLTANVLPTSGVTAATYGNSSQIPVITVDATGRITSATVNAVAGVTSFTYTEANNTFAIATGDGSTFAANIGTANATHTGVIKVLDSVANTSTTIAAAVSSVKTAYDAAIAANTSAASAYTNAVSYADTIAGTAYTNATSYAATIAGTAYSNGVTYTDNKAANAYSNATTFASNATNISSGTLAEARLPYRMDQNVRTNDSVSFGSVSITGNLTVTGTTVTINTTNLTVDDNIIYLNEGASGANVNPDLGIAGAYNDGTYRHAGFFRDASDGVWKVFDQYLPEPDASPFIDTANASFRIASFQANVVTAASFSGNGASVTSVNAATVGGNTAATLRSYSDSVAATAYTNAVSSASSSAATAYSNAVSYFTTNYTASDVLTKIKTVDGTGSGLDADTVDGYEASSFALKTDPEFTNDITTSTGQGRFGGWYQGTGYTGGAVEVGMSAGEGYVIAYNRGTSSYLNMNIAATDFQFDGQSSGYAHINTSFRAPIFYDSNNTGYYVDPASSSSFSSATFTSSNDNQITLNGNGTTWAGIRFVDVSADDYIWYNGGGSTFSIGGSGSNVSGKKLHVNGGMTVGSGYSATSNPTNGLNVEGTIQRAGNVVWDAANDGSGSGLDADALDGYGWTSGQTVSFGTGTFTGGNLSLYNTIGSGDNVRDGLRSYDTSAMGINVGGQLVLGYKYTSAGDYTEGAIIKMFKEDGTSGNYGSGLRFQVRDHAETLATRLWLYPSGYLLSDQSMRAPIFYDSDNTAFYVNPQSGSILGNVVRLQPNPGGGAVRYIDTFNNSMTNWQGTTSQITTWGLAWRYNDSSNTRAMIAYDHASSEEFQFTSGYGAIVFNVDYQNGHLDSPNEGTEVLRLTTYATAPTSMRSPIFYDSDNTGYYLDPASTSLFNATRHNSIVAGTTSGLSSMGQIGVYSAGSPYISFHDGTTSRTAYFQEAGGRFYLGEVTYTESEGSFRSPLFYDVNNTGYYVDPASTSKLNLVAGTLMGDLSGAPDSTIWCISGDYQNWGIFYNEGTPDFIEFKSAGSVTSKIGLDSGGIQSSAFYDIASTGYYIDPASTSVLNILNIPGQQAINTTTPGTTSYNLNFIGQSTVDYAQAITWSWAASGAAQAGIYVQSSGSYGTKMYLATTDSFATGSKTALAIDHSGIANFVRATPTVSGSTIWHAGNDGAGSGLDADRLDGLDATTAATASTIVARDSGGDITGRYFFGVHFNQSSSNSENPTIAAFWTNSGSDNYNRKSTPAHVISQLGLLTTSNYSSYALPLSGGTMTGDLSFDSSWLLFGDTSRDVGNAVYYPNSKTRAVRFSFADASGTGTGGNYSGVMHFHPWSGTTASTGDASYQLAFGSSAVNGGGVPILGLRKGIDTTWNSWYYLAAYGVNYKTGALYATQLIDSDDTGYYVDPNALSILTRLQTYWSAGNNTAGPTLRVSKGWNSGIGNVAYDTVVIEANDVATIRVGESDGTQGGICWGDSYNTYTSTHPMRFYTGGTAGSFIYSGMGGTLGLVVVSGSARSDSIVAGTTSTLSSMGKIGVYSSASPYISFHDGTTSRTAYFQEAGGRFYLGEVTYTESEGSFRSPLFYDVNNTSYYLDPASTSNLNIVSTAGGLEAPYIGIKNTTGSNGFGISLYNGYTGGEPTYGLMFQQTGTFGTYGAVSSDWATYFTMNSTTNRGWIFRNTSTGNVAAINNAGAMSIGSHFEQGNNIARPNVSWSASSTSTGMVIFYLPGTTSNYGMVHMVFDIYEYNGNSVSTVVVGGHNWSTSWYNYGANVIGLCAKEVRLGVKDGRFCVVFGTSGSSWSYGTIVLRKIHNGGFYDNIMDMVGNWSTTQTTTESFTNVTGDLRNLITPTNIDVRAIGYAVDSFRAPIFYDRDDTGYYIDPASTSNVSAFYAYSYRGNGNVSGTGNASYHPSGIYSTGTNWLYGTMYRNGYHTYNSGGSIYSTNEIVCDQNYGRGLNGVYSSTRFQHVWMMGTAYQLAVDGTSTGNAYGIAWSYPSAGGAAANLASHGMLILENGAFKGAWGGGRLVTTSDVRGTLFYDYDNTGYYVDPASTSNLGAAIFQANLYFSPSNGNTLNSGYSNAADGSDIWLNYRGYADGQSYYRNANIGDGRGNNIAWFDGPNKRMSINNGQSASYTLHVNGSIYSTGNITAYSDARKKENVVTVDNALDKVNKLRGVFYNKIDDEKKTKQIGVIAQEVKEVLPEVVAYAEDVDEYSVTYGNFAGLFIEAFKEQTKIINDLKQKIEELESKLNK